MIILFWFCSVVMIFTAVCIVLCFLPKHPYKWLGFIVLPSLIYSLYFHLGSSDHLSTYYSLSQKNIRSQQVKMRPLFSAMKKQEGRLQLKLQENPNDILSKALLLELLGVEALYRNEREIAVQFWNQALLLLPMQSEYEGIRNRIQSIKKRVDSKP